MRELLDALLAAAAPSAAVAVSHAYAARDRRRSSSRARVERLALQAQIAELRDRVDRWSHLP